MKIYKEYINSTELNFSTLFISHENRFCKQITSPSFNYLPNIFYIELVNEGVALHQ